MPKQMQDVVQGNFSAGIKKPKQH